MSSDDGWKELSTPDPRSRARDSRARNEKPRRLPETLRRSPFGRLARTHAFNAAGDGALALALAGSIFFSIDPSDARWRVALYLVCTVAPFAVVTPLIGPALDRVKGGRRAMVIVALGLRSVIAFLLIAHTDTLWLFPLAFALLILQKAYSIAKSALVPRLVENQNELVEANSKLALISGLSGAVGAGIGGFFSLFGGPGWSAAVACAIFAIGVVNALRLPKVAVAETPIEAEEKEDLRSRGITLAAGAMAALRGAVGFVTFLLAFELRGGEDGIDTTGFGATAGAVTGLARDLPIIDITGVPGAPVWYFGLVAAAAGASALAGARYAPRLRELYPEENILLGVLMIALVASLVASWAGDLFGAVLIAGAIGMAAATGKLVFDAIVQRDAPAANWGRSFASFEARFQLSWAIGAFVPAVVPLSGRASIGYLLVSLVAAVAGLWFFFGSRGTKLPSRPSRRKANDVTLSDDELRPSRPRPPAGTSEVMARYGGAVAAPKGAVPQFEPTQEFEATTALESTTLEDATVPIEAHTIEPVDDTWSEDNAGPVVSSSDGVEVDPDSFGWS